MEGGKIMRGISTREEVKREPEIPSALEALRCNVTTLFDQINQLEEVVYQQMLQKLRPAMCGKGFAYIVEKLDPNQKCGKVACEELQAAPTTDLGCAIVDRSCDVSNAADRINNLRMRMQDITGCVEL